MGTFSKIFVILLFVFSFSSALTLKEGFKLALENDMDHRVNKNNLNNIRYDQEVAKSLFSPQIDFSAKVETSKLTEKSIIPKDGSHTKSDEYELTLTQPIFDGYESKYEKSLQKERFKSAVFFLKESEGNVAFEYTQAYINTLKERDLLRLSKESLEISQNIFNKVYKKVNVGYGTKLEFEEAKGNYAENKVNLNIQRINLRESIENLRFYVQTDFDSSELIKPNFYINIPKQLNEAMDIALKNNPSINVSKTNVQVAMLEEKKANKDLYPDLNFVSSYTVNNALYAENDQESNEYSLGFELKYNLYNGGRDKAEIKKALQNIKDKKLLIKKSEYQVKNKLRLAWNSFKLNKEKQDSLEQYLIVKKDILDATIKEFDLGLKDLNTLLETHIKYIDVKKDLIRNTYDLLLAKYNILNSIGSLSNTLEDNMPSLKKIDSSDIVRNVEKETLYSFNNESYLDEKKLQVIKPKNYNISNVSNVNIIQKKRETIKTNIFKDKFLNASKDKYTINLAYTDSEFRAKKFIKKHNIRNNSFYFSFGSKKRLQKIMYGVYDSKDEAKEALNSLSKTLKRSSPRIESVIVKQKLFRKYHGYFKKENNLKNVEKNNSNVNVYKASFSSIEKTPKINVNKDLINYSFKDKFLNASKDKYTINLAYTDSEFRAKKFIKKHNIRNNSFYFSFGSKKRLQKIMYGVYDSKDEAKEALNSLSKALKRSSPRIESVIVKQKLFRKYNPNFYNLAKLGRI